MDSTVKESPSKNFKKSHSRNLEQADLILDFLSSLDKSKSATSWQEEINRINDDWYRRMESDAEDKRSTSQTLELSPSKKGTWSEKLTKSVTVSGPTEMYNLSGKQVKNCFSPKSSVEKLTSQNSENLYSERLKSANFHHKSGPKLRLVSVLTDNL